MPLHPAAAILTATSPTVPPSATILSNPLSQSGGGYLYRLLKQLGATDFQARTGEFVLLGPIRILLIVLGALILARLGSGALRRFVLTLRLRAPLRVRSARMEQRARTIADAVAGIWRVIVGVVATLMILGEVGLDLAPLLAGAGIAGLAIAFGAQALIRDYLSGLFILLEDQYGVGDVVTIGTASGTVEDLDLRVTRIRSSDGTVWFIPNGDIRQVGNQSMEWSRAVVDVTVAYDNDVPTVMAALGEEATKLSEEPAWAAMVLEPPELQGVQSMGTDGVTLRIVIKTAPRQQWAVARELRGRITERMRRDNVRGPGRTVLVSSGALDAGAPPPPPEAFDG
jgi:small-conductance mechanosensitive channel